MQRKENIACAKDFALRHGDDHMKKAADHGTETAKDDAAVHWLKHWEDQIDRAAQTGQPPVPPSSLMQKP